MRQFILLFAIFLLASCASNVQTGTAKYYSAQEAEHCQTVLQNLPNHVPVYASYDAKAPQRVVEDSLWTDPCRDVAVPVTYSRNESETTIETMQNYCTKLPGPWIATFVIFNGEPMPALIKAHHPQPSSGRYMPLNVYLNATYSEPIRLLVEYDGD